MSYVCVFVKQIATSRNETPKCRNLCGFLFHGAVSKAILLYSFWFVTTFIWSLSSFKRGLHSVNFYVKHHISVSNTFLILSASKVQNISINIWTRIKRNYYFPWVCTSVNTQRTTLFHWGAYFLSLQSLSSNMCRDLFLPPPFFSVTLSFYGNLEHSSGSWSYKLNAVALNAV